MAFSFAVQRSKSFGENAADRVSWSIDAKQRGECRSHINGLHARAIGASPERQSVEGQRNVRVVRVRRGVVGALEASDGVDVGNTEDVPASFWLVAVQKLAAEFGVGSFTRSEL